MADEDIWACPVCRLPLARATDGFICAAEHRFDRARQGYVNLLLANQKRSADPGDDAQMVAARRAFLDTGFYSPLADFLDTYTRAYRTETSRVLDLGCGEGYYLSCLNPSPRCFGIDVSKAAIKRAASRYKSISFAVANSYHLPVQNGSVDLVLAVFAPVSVDEIKRVLTRCGIFARVSPGPDHLSQIKRQIYLQVNRHSAPKISTGLQLLKEHRLRFDLELRSRDVSQLLAMTPLNWRGDETQKCKMLSASEQLVTCDFCIQVMQLEPR